MEPILLLSDLARFDSIKADPEESCSEPGRSALEGRVQRVVRRLSKVTRTDWRLFGPSDFPDGALFAEVSSGPANASTVFLFSKFGELFTTGRFGDQPYQYSTDEIEKLIAVISTDYGFKFVPPFLLNEEYGGVFTEYRMGTWYQRFFIHLYWTGGKPHEGKAKLRWP